MFVDKNGFYLKILNKLLILLYVLRPSKVASIEKDKSDSLYRDNEMIFLNLYRYVHVYARNANPCQLYCDKMMRKILKLGVLVEKRWAIAANIGQQQQNVDPKEFLS